MIRRTVNLHPASPHPTRGGEMRRAFALTAVLLAAAGAAAQDVRILRFTSEARFGGKITYLESHESEYRDGRVTRARTDYLAPDGKPVAYIESYFAESLAAPRHVFEDYRSGVRHGVRYEGGDAILFSRDPGQPEKTRNIGTGPAGSTLMVGCQGLFYYLQENYPLVREKRKIPLQLLITGTLDIYDFELELKSEKDGIAEITIHITNRFLRLFAPRLDVRYDTVAKRMLYYKGLSNILDDKGKIQTVEITYTY